jgi:hypothetical protein
MRPIWYFVGLILSVMGGIIFLTGLYLLISPSQSKTILSDTHPNIWWGLVILLFGLLMYFKTRNDTVQ